MRLWKNTCLPQLMIFAIDNGSLEHQGSEGLISWDMVKEIHSPSKICLYTAKEHYEYTLIGCVDSVGADHAVAKIKLENGDWLLLNDLSKQGAQKIDFDEYSKDRKLLFYEKINN